VKFGCVSYAECRHTCRQTDTLITILHTLPEGKVKMLHVSILQMRSIRYKVLYKSTGFSFFLCFVTSIQSMNATQKFVLCCI